MGFVSTQSPQTLHQIAIEDARFSMLLLQLELIKSQSFIGRQIPTANLVMSDKITSKHSASLSESWRHKSGLYLDRAPLKINTKHINIKAVERKGHLFFFHMFRTLSIFEVLYVSCSPPSPLIRTMAISETIKATVTKKVTMRANRDRCPS